MDEIAEDNVSLIHVVKYREITFDAWLTLNGYPPQSNLPDVLLGTLDRIFGSGTKSQRGKANGQIQRGLDALELRERYENEIPVKLRTERLETKNESYYARIRTLNKRQERYDDAYNVQNEKRKTKNEKRKTKNEKRKTKNEKRKTVKFLVDIWNDIEYRNPNDGMINGETKMNDTSYYKVDEAHYAAIKKEVAFGMQRTWADYRPGYENIPAFVSLYAQQSLAAMWLNFFYRNGFYKNGFCLANEVETSLEELYTKLERKGLRDGRGYFVSRIFVRVK
jgi:hypothetical protein